MTRAWMKARQSGQRAEPRSTTCVPHALHTHKCRHGSSSVLLGALRHTQQVALERSAHSAHAEPGAPAHA